MTHLALLAPPWIPIPPPAYGGIEQVVRLLSAGLVEAGHRVTLFAPPGSESPADVISPLEEAHPDEIQFSMWEIDHVAAASMRSTRPTRPATRSMSCTITRASPRSRWPTAWR